MLLGLIALSLHILVPSIRVILYKIPNSDTLPQ
jgi:hypothetical protein